jgi:pimeloyl-ACP methyl ester carboxylesterase
MIKDHYLKSYDGATIYVKEKYMSLESRSAKVVVCNAPAICSHQLFDCPISDYSLMDYLAKKGFTVFAVDYRGFGSSYKPPDGRSITLEVQLKDTEALVNFILAETKAKSVSMLGYGIGTQIACSHAVRHPDQVDGLVLVEMGWKDLAIKPPLEAKEMGLRQPNGYFETSVLSEFLGGLFSTYSPEIRAWFGSTFTVAPVGPYITILGAWPLLDDMEKIQAPVLIIYGTKSAVTTKADSFDFLSSINSQIRVIDILEGAGAIPTFEKDHYQKVLKDIVWFLSR